MANIPKYVTDTKSFNDYRKRVQQLRGRLENVVSEGESALSSVRQSQENAASELSSLQKTVAEAKVTLGTIPAYELELAKHKKALEDPKTGTQALLAKNAELEASLGVDIQKSDSLASQLDAAVKRADELNNDAQEILKRITAGSLSDAFGRRAAAINTSKIIWQLVIGVGVVLLLIVLVIVYLQFSHDIALAQSEHRTAELNIALLIMRVGFFTPLIFVIAFAARQYTKERDLQESYEYKSSVAATLPAFTKLLKDEFTDAMPQDAIYDHSVKQAILGKTLDWIDIVYADTKDIENHKSVAVRLKNSVLGAEIEQSTTDRHKQSVTIKTPSAEATVKSPLS